MVLKWTLAAGTRVNECVPFVISPGPVQWWIM